MTVASAQPSLVDDAIRALGNADRTHATQLLARAIAEEPRNELAWLWFSEVVSSIAERKFCLTRVLSVDPDHTAARFGMNRLDPQITPQAPATPPNQRKAQHCAFPGCSSRVLRTRFDYCYEHWKALNQSSRSRSVQSKSSAVLVAPPGLELHSSSALAERINLQGRRLNMVFAELGWIIKHNHGWKATQQGIAVGAVQQTNDQTGVPFVVWPTGIGNHPALMAAIAPTPQAVKTSTERSFRERFPAEHRTTDGHYVRSKAEMLIDNWLYMANIVHAYERQLPIDEEAYCDFYIPAGRVYIEYWGLEHDAKYAERKEAKRGLYQRYKLHLIELNDDHIKQLDDHLPRLLRPFGVTVT